MPDASLGTAVLRTKLDASGLKVGLQQAETETRKFAGTASEAIKSIGAGFAGIVASRGLRSYLGFMRESATVAQQAATSAALYEKALRRNNIAVDEGRAMVKRLADQFGLTNDVVEESATFLLRQGASLETVEKALVTAGASGAAAGFDLATAFNNVSVAVATGNSALLKTSGIVTTLGKAEQDYAKSVGKTVDNLTQEERIQARVAAIYKETASEIEDVDILLKGLPKSQADVNKELTTFRQTAGDLALKVLVPLQEGFAGVLRWVNGLPTPVKNAGIAMVGMATAATTLAAGLVAIRAALPMLSGLGLASFGPAGWVVLGVTAVAGLAAALAGANANSLTSNIDKARKAIGSGDANSITGALDALVKQVNGPVKDALTGMRDDLVATGDVGVEQAQRMLTELAKVQLDARRQVLGMSLFGPSRLGDALATGGVLLGKLDLKDQVRAALDDNDLLKAIDMLQDAIVAMTEAGLGAARSQPLVDFLAEIGGIAGFKFTPAPTPPPPGNNGNTNNGGGVAEVVKRTWADVLADLDKAGHEAMRRAAFENTPEAFREAARKRVGLIDDAITEALTTFYGQVSPQELAALAARRGRAMLEAREPVAAGTPPDPAALAGLKAQAAAIMADTMQAQAAVAEADRQARITALRETLANNSVLRQQALAIIADTNQAQADAWAAEEAQRAYIDSLDDTEAELGRWLNTADRLTVSIKAANDETARMGLFADALARYGSGRAGLAGTSAGDRSGLPLTGRDAAAAIARDTVEAVVDAFHAGSASVDDVRTAVDALTTLTPMSVAAIEELTDGILNLERAAQDAARAAMQNELAPMWVPPGGLPVVPGAGLPTSDYQGFRPKPNIQSDLDAAKRINDERQAAADRFRDTVISAGIGFTDTLVQGIQSGDLGSIIKGGFGAGGNILGSLVGGPWGMVIGGLLPILGGLFGGLFGGDRDTETRRREEQQRARSVPAININFSVAQQNTYNGAPSDPVNEQAFARQATILFESIYRRYLGPRLDSIERQLGLTGA